MGGRSRTGIWQPARRRADNVPAAARVSQSAINRAEAPNRRGFASMRRARRG